MENGVRVVIKTIATLAVGVDEKFILDDKIFKRSIFFINILYYNKVRT